MAIEAFIKDYNETARPFAWTKSKVYQKHKNTSNHVSLINDSEYLVGSNTGSIGVLAIGFISGATAKCW